MKRIAWGITGGGHYLRESLVQIRELSERNKISIFASRAGEEVLRMYGLLEELREIAPGGYLQEIFLESSQGASFPKAGRFMLGRYDLLLVAPATSNTVAKIAVGIADTLVTNAVALANKAGVPVYLLPTDVQGSVQSQMPYSIDRDLCLGCDPCLPKSECPRGAIAQQIDLMRCDGCGLCATLCHKNAIRGGTVQVRTREIDRQNIERLSRIPGFYILTGPEEIGSLY